MAAKTRFCGFLVSYAKRRRPACATSFSTSFADTKKWIPAGGALNNIGIASPQGAAAKLEFLRPYKFNIAFENASVPGYTTEKLSRPCRRAACRFTGATPRIDREFNPRSFLNYFDFPSEEALD